MIQTFPYLGNTRFATELGLQSTAKNPKFRITGRTEWTYLFHVIAAQYIWALQADAGLSAI